MRCYINIPLQIYQGINVSSFWSRRCCNMLQCYPLCWNIAGIFCGLWYAVMLFTFKLWKEAIGLGAEEFLELVFCDSVARAECIANNSLPIVHPLLRSFWCGWRWPSGSIGFGSINGHRLRRSQEGFRWRQVDFVQQSHASSRQKYRAQQWGLPCYTFHRKLRGLGEAVKQWQSELRRSIVSCSLIMIIS